MSMGFLCQSMSVMAAPFLIARLDSASMGWTSDTPWSTNAMRAKSAHASGKGIREPWFRFAVRFA